MDEHLVVIGSLYVELLKYQKTFNNQNDIIKSKDEEINKLKEMLLTANKRIAELVRDVGKGTDNK